jgi:hypothetical protein
MKHKPRILKLKTFALLLLTGFAFPLWAQVTSDDDKLNLPGDNLNLAAVLDIFQQSKTLEEFEQTLNTESNKINNLDLNNDEQTDYIKVIDNADGNLHSIVLQTDVSSGEKQDIAVIYTEKKGDDVTVQVIGDEDLYGKDYVIEPSVKTASNGTPNPGYTGDDNNTTNVTNNYYNTTRGYSPAPSTWIIIGGMYGSHYSRWHSPWYWGHYPGYWHAWHPVYWHDYHHHWYYSHTWNGWWYRPAAHFHYQQHWRNNYYGHRNHSATVSSNRSNGIYKRTYAGTNAETVRPAGKPNFPSVNKRANVKTPVNKPGYNVSGSEGRPGNDNTVKKPAARPVRKNRNDKKAAVRPPGEQVKSPEARPKSNTDRKAKTPDNKKGSRK